MHPVLVKLLTSFFIFGGVCLLIAGVCRWWTHRIDKNMLEGTFIDREALEMRRDDLVLVQRWALGVGGVFVFIALCTIVIAL